MFILVRNGKIIGKTNLSLDFTGIELQQFDSKNEDHRKAKFLREIPKEKENFINSRNEDIFTYFDWLHDLLTYMNFLSPERHTKDGKFLTISKSELRRLFADSAVSINGQIVTNSELSFQQVFSLVLFPRNEKKRVSIF